MGGRRQLFDFTSPIFGGTCLHVAAKETTRHGIGCNGCSTSGCRDRVPYILGRENALTSYTQGGSPVPKSGSLGSVRGASSNACPYRENAEQASKRTMRGPTRNPNRGRLIRLGKRADEAPSRRAGVLAMACTQGKAHATREAPRRGQG